MSTNPPIIKCKRGAEVSIHCSQFYGNTDKIIDSHCESEWIKWSPKTK